MTKAARTVRTEESASKVQEPLVEERPIDLEDVSTPKHPQPIHTKTLSLIFGKLRVHYMLSLEHFANGTLPPAAQLFVGKSLQVQRMFM